MSLTRVLAAWLMLAVVMILNGIFRELALVPTVGTEAAQVISVLLGIALVVALTEPFFKPLSAQPSSRLVRVAALLVSLTIAFEFVFGHFVDGKSWSELGANYALWNGRLWPLVLLALALTPWIWGRWAGRARRLSLTPL